MRNIGKLKLTLGGDLPLNRATSRKIANALSICPVTMKNLGDSGTNNLDKKIKIPGRALNPTKYFHATVTSMLVRMAHANTQTYMAPADQKMFIKPMKIPR
jgi:hypothetical protein